MTTVWLLLLLLLLIACSQSVDSQSTTDDEVCACDDAFLKHEMEMLLSGQQRMFEQLQLIMKRLGTWEAGC